MLDKIRDFLYNEEEGLLVRIRNGDYNLNQEEKEMLLDFAKEVNEKMEINDCNREESLISIDIIFNLMLVPELQNFAAEIFQNIMMGLDF